MQKIPSRIKQKVCLVMTGMGIDGKPTLYPTGGSFQHNLANGISGWIPIAEAEVEFEIPEDRRDPATLTIESLEQAIAKEKAESSQKVSQMVDQLQQLKALPDMQGEADDF